ncbi:hypothetical protein [Dyadobacter pollutisoli]|jgi:hypothetical protein|uniref:DUF4142 domain-containing protein n=1 Tax=Dyadobacter pollutisoli TaxID=2910158 RepID=A0A9E8SKV3_9BACT|nr:hypothetical protein [Dyadobacter pollutisoli]WAC12900.1 hypothetical protein ON006_02820 [Dyadobacter pollutisoli]
MRGSVVICFLLIAALATSTAAQTDKGAYYKALASDEEKTIDKVLASLEAEKATPRVNAYKGVLTMKKAGFVKGVGGKLKTFKKGVHLLEEQIKGNPANTEFRFLRLTIQEHAPGILKYNNELHEDKQAIVSGYSRLDADLREVISDYAKDSKVLKESDLK